MRITTIRTVIQSEEKLPGKKVVKKSGQRIGYYYIMYKSLKRSQKNDVVKCFYIKGLLNFGFCVIKEGTFGDSMDKQGRDITDRLKWQYQLHDELSGKVGVPKLIGSFEENGNYYLVVQMIRGVSMGKFIKSDAKNSRGILMEKGREARRIIDYMIQMVTLLDELHEQEVVHRDVTPANFIIKPDGKIALIDLELSYSLKHEYPKPAFILGTYGYMSPEQMAVAVPTIQEDIFSVGAILLQIFGGLHPMKLTEGPYDEIVNRVNFLISDQKISNIISQCFDPTPLNRPSLKKVREELIDYKREMRKIRPVSTCNTFDRSAIRDTIQSAINALFTPLFSDEDGWFSANLETPFDDKKKIIKARYASFTHGDSGIIYTLSKARSSGFNTSFASEILRKSLTRIDIKYISKIDKTYSGLYQGADGIAVALCEGLRTGLLPDFPVCWIEDLLKKESSGNNLSSGIAGQGFANIYCDDFLDQGIGMERLTRYVGRLIKEQEKDGSWLRFNDTNTKRITKGYANGIAGIVHFLFAYTIYTGDYLACDAAEKGLNWLIKNAQHSKGLLQWTSNSNQLLAPWSADGGAGIALAFIIGYEVTKKPIFKTYATSTLNTVQDRIFESNVSQQEGLSGLGEVYLEAYRVFGEKCWLDRADWIAQLIMIMKKTHKEYGTYWLVQDEKSPFASFMTGNAGVLHFLLRFYDHEIGLPFIRMKKMA